MYAVRLKTSHPLGTYRRAGMLFHRIEPVLLEELPEAVAKDPWLVVEEVAPPAAEPSATEERAKGKRQKAKDSDSDTDSES